MVKQQIFLNDILLLTIFHETMDYGIEGRVVSESEDTYFGTLIFIEETVEAIGEIKFDEVNEGFLENQNKKNPYYSYSVYFNEFIRYDKPLFENGNLKIESKTFNLICNFIEKKSGYKVTENPYSIGNVLIFKPSKIECKYFEHKKNISGIDVIGLSDKSLTIIKLKTLNIVKETYAINGEDCRINPKHEWSSFDIEVYEDGKIVYARYDVYLMRRIDIKTTTRATEIHA